MILLCSLRLLGLNLIEDTDSAWFPVAELREVHGIVPKEPTEVEVVLFCIQPDGSEGLCCPNFGIREKALQEEE